MYKSLFSLLALVREGRFLSKEADETEAALESTLRNSPSLAEAKKILNDYKNREIYYIDLDHILRPERGFSFLSLRFECPCRRGHSRGYRPRL